MSEQDKQFVCTYCKDTVNSGLKETWDEEYEIGSCVCWECLEAIEQIGDNNLAEKVWENA